MSSRLPATVDLDLIDFARRNRLTQRLALIFVAIIALFLVLAMTIGQLAAGLLLNQLLMLGFFSLLAWITSWQRSRYAPELLVSAVLLHGLVGALHTGGISGIGPTIFFVALALAGMLVRWTANLVFGALSIVAVLLLALLAHRGIATWSGPAAVLSTPAMINTYAIVYGLLLVAVCTISCISAHSHERSLRQMAGQAAAVAAQNQQLAAQSALVQQQAIALEQHRDRLEREVAARTAELTEALAELRQSAITLRELQSPLVPIADGVLVMPLVGAFDSVRAAQLIETLLRGIQARQARIVLLDLTGLPQLDSLAAETLVQVARAARLLGASVQLVGVTPAVAQTIVGLGLDLGALRFERDLQSAVAGVLRQAASAAPTRSQRPPVRPGA